MKNPKKYSFLISKIFYILKFEKKSVTFFPPKKIVTKKFLAENVFGVFDRSGKHFQHTHTIFENFQNSEKKTENQLSLKKIF